jgi:D-alanyl-D-alanine carboxypeptidase
MENIKNKLDILSKKLADSTPTLQAAISIPGLKLNYNYSSTSLDQIFHSASVGKLMTATLIFILIEQAKLSLGTKINDILADDTLEKLFVFRNIDYKKEVTIRQLLNHTSGVNDYFEGRTVDKVKFIDEVISKQNKIYVPLDLVNFTRVHQNSNSKPGEKFLYSDTGYVLLGLIIEKITRMSFSNALDTYIFKPLNMKNTGLCFYSKNFDANKLAPIYLKNKEISKYKSLSCDFSGGGLFTSAADLSIFINSFMEHKLVKEATINLMEDFKYPFHSAMFYGLGLMQLRFEKFFFLLKNMPRLQGHLGVLGVHAWYNKETKDVYILNVGSTKDMVKSFRYLINIVNIVEKEKKQLVK